MLKKGWLRAARGGTLGTRVWKRTWGQLMGLSCSGLNLPYPGKPGPEPPVGSEKWGAQALGAKEPREARLHLGGDRPGELIFSRQFLDAHTLG